MILLMTISMHVGEKIFDYQLKDKKLREICIENMYGEAGESWWADNDDSVDSDDKNSDVDGSDDCDDYSDDGDGDDDGSHILRVPCLTISSDHLAAQEVIDTKAKEWELAIKTYMVSIKGWW